MKKLTLFVPLAMVAALGLTSCGSGEGKTASLNEVATADTAASITYAVWDEKQRPALEKNIADFNKTYPKIKVTVDLTPWAQYWTKLQTQGSSNTLPDVFWMNGPNFQLYASNGQLEPLTSSIAAKKLDPTNYPKALVDMYSFNNVEYGVPKDFDTVALWYNKAILAQAGVAVPTDKWTWEDFKTAAKAVSDKLKAKGIYGVAGEMNGQIGAYNTILQAGGSVISADGKKSGYDNPKTIEGLKFWADLVANGSSPTPKQLSDTPANVWFTSNKSAFFWGGSWATADFSTAKNTKTLDVVPLPRGTAQATVIHGLANVVSAKSKNKAAAMAFGTYLGSKEAQLTQAKTGTVIPAFNGTQDAFVASVPHFNLQVFLDGAKNYSFPLPISKNTAAWNQLEADLLPQAFSGQRPVEEVAAELATKMNESLAKE
jgi:multiple sugar transport system substrate-binding protein